MANFNSIGSGIDVNAIVSSFMEVEKVGISRLEKVRNLYDFQLANYNKFNTLLKNFSQAIDNIQQTVSNNSYKVQTSDEAILSAVLTGNHLSPSKYSINITQLAQAQQIASTAFATDKDALGITDVLDVQVGGATFSLPISSTDSLEKIRDTINNSFNNPGISATILSTTSSSGTPEYRLMLSSSQTGVANQLQITGGTLTSLGLTNEITAAQDAQFTFNGFNVTRSSNTVSDLLDGVTFTLNAANSSATVQIIPDNGNKNETIKKAVHTLVDAYNTLIETIDKNQSTKTLRDNTYSAVKLNLQNTMTAELGSSSIKSLFDIGVKTAESHKSYNEDGVEYVSTGKLVIDDALLSSALYENSEDVFSFFTTPTTGFVAAFKSELYDITKLGGNISHRETSIKEQESKLDDKIGREESRLDVVKEKLIQQYSALNLFVQHYQQISKFLEQQLDQLNNFNK